MWALTAFSSVGPESGASHHHHSSRFIRGQRKGSGIGIGARTRSRSDHLAESACLPVCVPAHLPIMADTDLTSTILRFTDRHLGLPLLSHLASLDLFKQEDVAKAMFELARGTSMIDFSLQLHEQAFPGQAPPPDLDQQRDAVVAQNEKLAGEVETVLNVIEDPTVANSLRQDKAQNLQWLEENYQLTLEQISSLYRFGYFQYSCGNYREASSYLYHFRVLSTDPVLTVSSHWGKLASDILTGEWDRALEELKLLREFIDSSRPDTQGGHEAILERRTWLLHWSLFVWFNHPEGREGLVEMFLSPPYLNTIQTTCWWLLRYLIAALITTRRTTRVYIVQTGANATNPNAYPTTKMSPAAALQEVTKILQQESHRIGKDPVLHFLRELYSNFDFEAAQEQLRLAQAVAVDDFFISEHADSFVESARFLVSEAYCRIHKRVDIADLSRRLNMSKEEGEKWIVNLVRDTRADAKIDFKEGIVHMNQPHMAVYQNVIEKVSSGDVGGWRYSQRVRINLTSAKLTCSASFFERCQTRGFTFRSAAMGQAMDRKAHPHIGGPGPEGTRGGRGGGRGGRGGRGGGRGGAQGDRGDRGDRGQGQGQQQPQANGAVAPSEGAPASAPQSDAVAA